MRQIIHNQEANDPNQDTFQLGEKLITMTAYDFETILLVIIKSSRIMANMLDQIDNFEMNYPKPIPKEVTANVLNIENEAAYFGMSMFYLRKELPGFFKTYENVEKAANTNLN